MSYKLSAGEKEKFESMVTSAMADMHIPGMSIALVEDSEILYARGFGARNLEENLPATTETLYGIGSCTKSFTATAIMQLMEDDKLLIADPITKYLPVRWNDDDDPITIHHLLSMSSGMPNLGVASILIGRLTGQDTEKTFPMSSFDDLLVHLNGAKDELATDPGKRYFYFNSGYTLLGEIVARVTKLPYARYIREKILDPLGMKRSTFLQEQFEQETDRMTPYVTQQKDGEVKLTPTNHPFNKLIFAPGGLLSSVTELSNYLSTQIGGGVFEGEKLLDASLMNEMHKIQFETEFFRHYIGDYGKMGYGYGWMVASDFHGHKLVMHGGSTGVSSAQLMFLPELKIGLAATANVGQVPIPVLQAALVMLLGKDPEREIPDFTIQKKMDLLTGEYAIYKGIVTVSVVQKGAMLYLEGELGGQKMSVPLIPEGDLLDDLKFYIIQEPGKKLPIEFDVADEGKIDLYVERNRFHKIKGKIPD